MTDETTRRPGDRLTFYNGGSVIIDWVEDGQIGYRLFHPGDVEPYLLRKTFAIFEKAVNRDHCIYEGQMA